MKDTKTNSKDVGMDPRTQIQRNYARWVDDVCEMCDWKTSITMEEVQAQYSKLAIELAIKELSVLRTNPEVYDRIQYLQSLIND